MPQRRETDTKRQGGPWPTPVGMGALVSPDDFHAAKARQEDYQAEEAAFDKGGMSAVNKLRNKK